MTKEEYEKNILLAYQGFYLRVNEAKQKLEERLNDLEEKWNYPKPSDDEGPTS